jgi:hypothetical protein
MRASSVLQRSHISACAFILIVPWLLASVALAQPKSSTSSNPPDVAPDRSIQTQSPLTAPAIATGFQHGLLVPYPGTGGWSYLSRNDDGYTGLLDLGFTFEFYGASYDEVCVNNNGNISFERCYSAFTAEGFPSDEFIMVAPFWADVDTRCLDCGLAYYKTATLNQSAVFIAHWERVGYYSQRSDKLNTFQVVIADLPVLPGGNNVCFGYGDMQWTTGSASGGSGGFGGAPAVVGANRGNGTDFFLYGTFDRPGTDYDGPGGTDDGVGHLTDQTICFNTSGASGNVPPIASGFNDGDVFEVHVGDTFSRTFVFLSPELGQTTTVSVNGGGLANFTSSVAAGNTASATLTFVPSFEQGGDNEVVLTATDNGTPSLSTTVAVVLRVRGGTSNEDEARPNAVRLDSAFPNPSRGAITVPFNLPEVASVRLAVYDLLGREVAVLTDGVTAAGEQTATWDGRDADGREASAGLYILQLTASGHVQTRTLIRVE